MFSHLLAKFQCAGTDRGMRHLGYDRTVADPEICVLRISDICTELETQFPIILSSSWVFGVHFS